MNCRRPGLTSGRPPDKAGSVTSTDDAKSARAQLLSVLSNIRSAYRTLTNPIPLSTRPTASGPVPSYLTNQLASYTLALNMLNGGSGSSSLA